MSSTTIEELEKTYEEMIDKSESIFEKNILKAELKHKLSLLSLGLENITPPNPEDCIACSG